MGNIRTMADLRKAVEDAVQILLALFAVGLLALAPVYATRGHVDIAGTLAGLFLLSMLTLSLPRLRAIEAFGVKAQLRKEIRKAEITLDQLKTLARSSIRQGFLQARTLPIAERRSVMATLNESIGAAELTDAEAAEFRRPLLDSLAQEILYVVQSAAVHMKVRVIHDIEERLLPLQSRTYGAPDPNEPMRTELTQEKDRLMALRIPARPGNATVETLPDYLDACAVDFPRSPDDDRRLRNVIAHGRRIMRECAATNLLPADFDGFTSYRAHYLAPEDGPERAAALLGGRFGEE